MSLRHGTILVASLLCAVQTVVAQNNWVPVVAKFRETAGLRTAPGRVDPRTIEYHGEYIRNSEGSTLLVRVPVVDGQERPDRTEEVLTDARTGKVMDISYRKHTAVVRQQLKLPLVPMKPAQKDIIGQQVVNGLRCVGTRVTCVNARLNTSGICGVSWRSLDYDFTVKMEISEALPGGAERFHVVERYDIQMGSEPDAARFEVPPGLCSLLRFAAGSGNYRPTLRGGPDRLYWPVAF